MGEESERSVLSFSNFNPVAVRILAICCLHTCSFNFPKQLFTLFLLAVGVVLGSVGMGIGEWSRFDTDRVDNLVVDGSTFKTVSLLSRCVSYELTQEIVELGLALELQPQVWIACICTS